MPVGANFGVENKKSSKNKRGNLSNLTGDGNDEGMALTLEKLETSNRELARLFVEVCLKCACLICLTSTLSSYFSMSHKQNQIVAHM